MIKRGTALAFILVANIILLAHAVIPHHHHHSSDFFTESSACQTVCKSHEHSDCEHNSSSKEHYDCCVLKQVVTIPSNQIKPEFKFLICNNDHNTLDTFQSVLFTSEYSNSPIACFAVKRHNYRTSSTSRYVGSCQGLRAPPVV